MTQESILWVEDEAYGELQYLYAPVVVAGFDLHVAGDATQAIAALRRQEFDAVIVDIRIPPGHDDRWIKLYNKSGANPAAAKLGIHLLRALLLPEDDACEVELDADERPAWLTAEKCGVFSVEVGGAVDRDLKKIGIGLAVSEVKGATLGVSALLDLVRKVLASSDDDSTGEQRSD